MKTVSEHESLIELDAYSHEELSAAFDLIKNQNDWRAPIAAAINADQLKVCANACVYFTATYLEVVEDDGGLLFVEADGYRKGPAGP